DRSIAVAYQISGLAHHGIEEGDRIVRHHLIGNGALNVRCVPMSSALGGEDMEVFSERVEVGLEESGVDEAAMQENEGIALTKLGIPGPHVSGLHVGSHAWFLSPQGCDTTHVILSDPPTSQKPRRSRSAPPCYQPGRPLPVQAAERPTIRWIYQFVKDVSLVVFQSS